MNRFLKADTSVCKMMISRVQEHVKLPPQSIEKDLWVTQVLHALFSLPVSQHLVFKGGTSLSKAWGLIDRFSEDIDLAINPELFGMPDADPTKRQIKKLRKASSLYVAEELAEMLRARLDEMGLSDWLTVKSQPNGVGDDTYPEPRQVYVEFKSMYQDSLAYLRPMIVLEVSARSLIEPVAKVGITSLMANYLPVEDIAPVPVTTAVAGKTMVEKMFLLHELFSVAKPTIRAERKSRHLYDLYMMMRKPFAKAAIADDTLWEAIRHHREIYTSVHGVDYTPDIRDRLVLIPQEESIAIWKQDYEQMMQAMIYGERPTWEQLLAAMEELQYRTRSHSTLQ